MLGGDHSISYPVVRAVSEKLGGPVEILHLDAHPDIYDCFEGNTYSHASSFARIMEGGYARRLLQVIVLFHLCIPSSSKISIPISIWFHEVDGYFQYPSILY